VYLSPIIVVSIGYFEFSRLYTIYCIVVVFLGIEFGIGHTIFRYRNIYNGILSKPKWLACKNVICLAITSVAMISDGNNKLKHDQSSPQGKTFEALALIAF